MNGITVFRRREETQRSENEGKQPLLFLASPEFADSVWFLITASLFLSRATIKDKNNEEILNAGRNLRDNETNRPKLTLHQGFLSFEDR